MDGYGKLFEDIKAGKILSAYAVEGRGAAEAVEVHAEDRVPHEVA